MTCQWLGSNPFRAVGLVFWALVAATLTGNRCATADASTTIALYQNDLAYNPSVSRIYATVPSKFGPQGNSIAVIDPSSGTVEAFIPVGSEPNRLAVSEDARTLFVGLDGAGEVREMNLPALTPRTTLHLGVDVYGHPRTALDLAPVSHTSDGLAVATVDEVLRFENGAPKTNGDQNRAFFGDAIAATTSPARLWWFDSTRSSFGLTRIDFATGDQTALSESRDIFTRSCSSIQYANGLLYGNDGRIVDPETLALAGTLSSELSITAVAPDPASNRVGAIGSDGSSNWSLIVYDLHTYLPLESIPLPSLAGTNPANGPRRLLRWGASGFAFGSDKSVSFVRSPSVPAPSTASLVLSVAPSAGSLPAAETLTYTLTVTNAGATSATDVLVVDTLPVGVPYVSGDTDTGWLLEDARVVTVHVGTLPPGLTATIHLAVSPPQAGEISNLAVVTANEPDSVPANRVAMSDTTISAPLLPDLTVAWSSPMVTKLPVRPYTVAYGVRGTLVVRNLGRRTARPSVLRVFLQGDPSENSAGFAVLLKELRVGAVPGQGSRTVRISTHYTGIALASGYLLAVVDANDAVAEADEQNNTDVAGPF